MSMNWNLSQISREKSDQSEGIPGAGIPERVVQRNDYRIRRPSSPLLFPPFYFRVCAF